MFSTKKIFAVIMTVVLVASTLLLATGTKVAAANFDTPLNPEHPVNPTIWNPSANTFRGHTSWNAFNANGDYLKIYATTWASDGVSRDVTITIYLLNANRLIYAGTLSDGYEKYIDRIPLNGGDSVLITADCDDSSVDITVDLYIMSYYAN